jgi:hypothetical protein
MLSSCQLETLRSDYRESALKTNYHAAEIISKDGTRSIGLAAFTIDPMKPVEFSVQGYGSGYVRIHSDACDIDESKTYSDFALVDFTVFTADTRCLLDVFVEPQFKASQASGIKWQGMSGVILLKRNKYPVTFVTKQISLGKTISLPLNLPDESQRVFIDGCGFRFDHHMVMSSLNLRIDLGLDFKDKLCVIEGFIDGKQHQEISILVSQYNIDYAPLPIPEVSFGPALGTFYVNADESVSIMNYGHQTKFSNASHFENEPARNYALRLYTVQGRTEVCDFIRGVVKCSK